MRYIYEFFPVNYVLVRCLREWRLTCEDLLLTMSTRTPFTLINFLDSFKGFQLR